MAWPCIWTLQNPQPDLMHTICPMCKQITCMPPQLRLV
jgi:hypothetical protein